MCLGLNSEGERWVGAWTDKGRRGREGGGTNGEDESLQHCARLNTPQKTHASAPTCASDRASRSSRSSSLVVSRVLRSRLAAILAKRKSTCRWVVVREDEWLMSGG